MNLLLHITARSDWQRAQTDGAYRADSLATEGFIHCSTPEQILATAGRYYRGQRGLLLLGIDADRVRPETRWEAIGTAEPFPHVYGPLNLDAVFEVWEFEPNDDGTFTMPPGVSDL